ncbi:arginase family protein [Salinibacterium sp. ZJ70]|uniref:arginase family protein n=1 Tax=Salinibacterium sp. ZJ70 TaxID=2708084 RepID=UPI001CD6EF0F|nr:arginase family protein [Salinibacterium sp. ZJ70]
MRLADGARAIRADLPANSTREVDVPLEAGDSAGSGIARFGAVLTVRERLTRELSQVPSPAIVIGGDCGVSAGAIAHAASEDVAVVWFDAHPDLNTAITSPSGAFAGMVLASLVEEGVVAGPRVVIAGARDWDAAEEEFAAEHGIRAVAASEIDADVLVEAVAATGAARIYVHIDLDVLDPSELSGLLTPIPFGVATGDLVAAIRGLCARFPLAGATIASFAPESEAAAVDGAPTILRLIAALRS